MYALTSHRLKQMILCGVVCFILAVTSTSVTLACTRAVYHGEDSLVITGRSMDWRDLIPASMWILPRGLKHDGGAGPRSVQWTSKYGSVAISSFGFSTVDGMNEKGLSANLLWLAGSKYPEDVNSRPTLSVAAWVQYMLDNYDTVNEAVEAMSLHPISVVSSYIPGTDRFATLHLSISDASGDSAIFEYIDGKLVIHHGRQYQVMTNDPSYNEQLAIEQYWQGVGGTLFLPGTNRSADRFARASFYIHAIPKTANSRLGVAEVMSVMRNVSVPYGITTPGHPNISTTRWRTVADQKDLHYFFESALTPSTFWVDLKQVDLRSGAPVLRLPLEQEQIYSGNAHKEFKPSAPLEFLTVDQAEQVRSQQPMK